MFCYYLKLYQGTVYILPLNAPAAQLYFASELMDRKTSSFSEVPAVKRSAVTLSDKQTHSCGAEP